MKYSAAKIKIFRSLRHIFPIQDSDISCKILQNQTFSSKILQDTCKNNALSYKILEVKSEDSRRKCIEVRLRTSSLDSLMSEFQPIDLLLPTLSYVFYLFCHVFINTEYVCVDENFRSTGNRSSRKCLSCFS